MIIFLYFSEENENLEGINRHVSTFEISLAENTQIPQIPLNSEER